MNTLGQQQFAAVGHDTGFAISYALAPDFPDRVARVVLAELPGSSGAALSPPVFVPAPIDDRLWHLPFNRLDTINEQLVTGREDVFFRWGFDAAAKKLPDETIDYSFAASPTPTPCAAALGSTACSTRPSRKTASARPGG